MSKLKEARDFRPLQITVITLTALVSLLLVRNVDFRVYWYAVTGFFDGLRPAYGPQSGIGAPMDYVYPPPSYLLLYPIRWLPLRSAGFLWMLGEVAALILSVKVAVRSWSLTFRPRAIILCLILVLPYLVLSARYGNVQPFAIAFLLISLATAKDKPSLSGLLFALAIILKATPLFFLPWFLRRRKALVSLAVWTVILWTLPFAIFGFHGYLSLLRDWYYSAGYIGATPSEFHYFPGQTLRALCLRFLTPIAPPIPGYPSVNFLSLTPGGAVRIWELFSVAIYVFAVFRFLRSNEHVTSLWVGQAFVLYSLLQPFAVKVSLISLGPAAFIGAAYISKNSERHSRPTFEVWGNRCYWAAALVSLIGMCFQERTYLRFLQTIGIDFWISSLLAASFCFWISNRHSSAAEHSARNS